MNNKSMNSPRILDFPEIPPTLMSCIFELSEDFFKISKDPERSMSKLSNEPNTIKNGHLAQKLGAMKDRRFSENSLSQLHYFLDTESCSQNPDGDFTTISQNGKLGSVH